MDGARPEDSTPAFAEMAAPGTAFEGDWDEKTFFLQPEVRRSIRWPELQPRPHLRSGQCLRRGPADAAAAIRVLGRPGCSTRAWRNWSSGWPTPASAAACLLCLGWGGGLPAKSAWLDTTNADYRQILQQFALYNRALASNLPFPKTRRIVFLNNQPATLPGWVELAIEE